MTMLAATTTDAMVTSFRRVAMKNLSLLLLVCAASFSFCFIPQAKAQQDPKADRKVVTRVEPDYPPVLRMRQIGGTVRLEITITPQGTVASAKVLGGNPVLAESAVSAVKKWKYVSAENSTTAVVSFEFDPFR